jgi:hypothetical protein
MTTEKTKAANGDLIQLTDAEIDTVGGAGPWFLVPLVFQAAIIGIGVYALVQIANNRKLW